MKTTSKILPDNRPTDLEYAFISKSAYNTGPASLIKGHEFETKFRKWFIMHVCDNDSGSGYFGVVLRCDISKQIVIAHRGTNDLHDLFEDLKGIFFNKYSSQKDDAFQLVRYIVDVILEENSMYRDYTLSFTGHSLGGFLAEMCVFYAKTVIHFEGTSAVSFDSPGSKQSMQLLHSQLNSRVTDDDDDKPPQQLEIDWYRKLDITCYLCYPNAVNACNDHVGSVYAMNVYVHGGMFASLPGIRLLNSHRMHGIVNWFEEASIHKNPLNRRLYMADWPKGCKQLKIFYKNAVFKNKLYNIEQDLLMSEIKPPPVSTKENYLCKYNFPFTHSSTPNLTHNHGKCREFDEWFKEQKKKITFKFYGNFKVLEIDSSFLILPLHHFSPPMQSFLLEFYSKRTKLSDEVRTLRKYANKRPTNCTPNFILQNTWKVLDIPEDVAKSLVSYEIHVNSIDIQEVICGSHEESIHEFRRKLSSWLAKTSYTVEHLVPWNLLHQLGSYRLVNLYEKSHASNRHNVLWQ